jgi:hypothetical protein
VVRRDSACLRIENRQVEQVELCSPVLVSSIVEVNADRRPQDVKIPDETIRPARESRERQSSAVTGSGSRSRACPTQATRPPWYGRGHVEPERQRVNLADARTYQGP